MKVAAGFVVSLAENLGGGQKERIQTGTSNYIKGYNKAKEYVLIKDEPVSQNA